MLVYSLLTRFLSNTELQPLIITSSLSFSRAESVVKGLRLTLWIEKHDDAITTDYYFSSVSLKTSLSHSKITKVKSYLKLQYNLVQTQQLTVITFKQ